MMEAETVFHWQKLYEAAVRVGLRLYVARGPADALFVLRHAGTLAWYGSYVNLAAVESALEERRACQPAPL